MHWLLVVNANAVYQLYFPNKIEIFFIECGMFLQPSRQKHTLTLYAFREHWITLAWLTPD